MFSWMWRLRKAVGITRLFGSRRREYQRTEANDRWRNRDMKKGYRWCVRRKEKEKKKDKIISKKRR